MRAAKSLLRWFMGLQALALLLIPVGGLFGTVARHNVARSVNTQTGHATYAASSLLLGYAFFFAVGLVFAMAWWTTRKPFASLNFWALGASVVYLVEGAGLIWLAHHYVSRSARSFDSDALVLIALGIGGLLVFSRREVLPDPASIPPKRTSVAGDRTSAWTRYGVTAISVVAQIALINAWYRWAYVQHLHYTRGLVWIALLTLASILTTIIHECGHAILAWCFKMGIISFTAGPFHARKREGKWSFKFCATGLITPGGSVGVIPTDPDAPRWEEIGMIIAGPAANLLIGLPVIYAVLHDTWGHYQQTWEFIAFTGSFCLVAAVLNLFPFMSEDGGYSDGARILQILTKSPLDDYHRTMASIASTVITPRRYRDLDIEAIKRAASLFPHELRGLHLHLSACHFFEDSNRLPEAAAAMASAEAIYNNFSIDLPGPIHTVFAIGHAYLNRDAAAARLWWNRMETKKDKRRSADYWLAKAALHWIEGNSKEADEAWCEADAEASKLPQFGAYEFDRFRCALLRQAFEEPETLRNAARVSAPVPSPTLVPTPIPATAVSTLIPVRTAPATARSAEANSLEVGGISEALARILSPPRVISAEVATLDAAAIPNVLSQLAPSAVAHLSDELVTPEVAVLPDTFTQFVPPTVAASSRGVLAQEIAGIAGTPGRVMPTPAGDSLSAPGDPIVSLPNDSVIIPSAVPLPDVAFTRPSTPTTPILAPTPDIAKRAGISWETAPPASPAAVARTTFTPTPVAAARTAFTHAPVAAPAKGPAVPAAFARRPRTVGPPLSDPFDVPAAEDISATTPPVELVSDVTLPVIVASVEPVPAASVTGNSTPATPLPVGQTQPVAEDNGRFDPLAFIRAAAMENIST